MNDKTFSPNFEITKNKIYFFSENRPFFGHFLKKRVFCPLEMSNICKNIQNQKIGEKWLSIFLRLKQIFIKIIFGFFTCFYRSLVWC